MGFDADMTTDLTSSTESLSLKDLRRRRIQNVRVITRSHFNQVIQELAKKVSEEPTGESKRITRLLEEVEKLGQAKIALEHEKGLLEAERSRLQADMADVAQAMGKELGNKFHTDEVRTMVKELVRLRDEREKNKRAMDTLQKQAKARIEEEVARGKALSQERESLVRNIESQSRETKEIHEEIERLRGERDRLEEERNACRDQVDDMRNERDQYRHERDEYRDERDLMREQRDQYREERDLMREQRESLLETQAAYETQLNQMRRHLEELEEELDAVAREAEPLAEETPQEEEVQAELVREPARPRSVRAPRGSTQSPHKQVPGFGFGFGFGSPKGRG